MRQIQTDVHKLAVDNGWWPEGTDLRIVPEKLALIHSEISEALEEYRSLNERDLQDVYFNDGSDKPEGFGVELADAIIRIFDLAEFLGLDMEYLVLRKHAYNQTRSYRHGGKLA